MVPASFAWEMVLGTRLKGSNVQVQRTLLSRNCYSFLTLSSVIWTCSINHHPMVIKILWQVMKIFQRKIWKSRKANRGELLKRQKFKKVRKKYLFFPGPEWNVRSILVGWRAIRNCRVRRLKPPEINCTSVQSTLPATFPQFGPQFRK